MFTLIYQYVHTHEQNMLTRKLCSHTQTKYAYIEIIFTHTRKLHILTLRYQYVHTRKQNMLSRKICSHTPTKYAHMEVTSQHRRKHNMLTRKLCSHIRKQNMTTLNYQYVYIRKKI